MLIDVSKVIVNDRIRKEFGDIEELAADIAENGLINPPVVSPDFVLVAGERRLRACKHLGWQQIEVRIISVKDYEHQLKLEISENQKRKNFTFSEGLEWARRLEQVEKLKARERMSEGAKGTQNFAEPAGESAAIVATETGFGNKETYRQAKFVADHADTETIARLDAEETSIHAEYVRLKAKFADAAKLAQDQAADITKLKKELEQSQVAQKMLADLKKPDTVTVEKRIEVIPPDYEKLKFKLDTLENENKLLKLQADTRTHEDERDDYLTKASTFTARIRNFIRDMAAIGYLGGNFSRLSPQGQKDYEAAITSLEKLCQDMRDQLIIPKNEQVYEMEVGQ